MSVFLIYCVLNGLQIVLDIELLFFLLRTSWGTICPIMKTFILVIGSRIKSHCCVSKPPLKESNFHISIHYSQFKKIHFVMRDPVLGFIYLSKIHIFLPNNVRYTLYKSTLIYLATNQDRATTITIIHTRNQTLRVWIYNSRYGGWKV